jgi:hypothetical protein
LSWPKQLGDHVLSLPRWSYPRQQRHACGDHSPVASRRPQWPLRLYQLPRPRDDVGQPHRPWLQRLYLPRHADRVGRLLPRPM